MAEDTKEKILIVEDEALICKAYADELRGEKFLVLTAANGAEGLALALSEKPDIILLDIIMPVMDGIAMLKKLREDAWGKGVPVMMLTNANDNAKVADALGAGSYDYLIKSDWKIEDVVAKIQERLAHGHEH